MLRKFLWRQFRQIFDLRAVEARSQLCRQLIQHGMMEIRPGRVIPHESGMACEEEREFTCYFGGVSSLVFLLHRQTLIDRRVVVGPPRETTGEIGVVVRILPTPGGKIGCLNDLELRTERARWLILAVKAQRCAVQNGNKSWNHVAR